MKPLPRFLLLLFMFVLTACAAVPVVQTQRYFWPPPPDKPRIEWIKSYSSQLDIEKNGAQRFWAALSGDDQPISLVKPLEVRSVPELGRFYVSDVGLASVIVFDLAKHQMRNLETPQGAPRISQPVSIVTDYDNNLYLLERRSNAILVFNRFEKYLRAIDLSAVASVSRPLTLSIDKMGKKLFLSDAATKKIYVLDLSGKLLFSFGAGGGGAFNLPISIAINSKGNIVVVDAFEANVQIFDSAGKPLRRFGKRGDAPGDLQLPKSVAVDSADNIYVVDGRSHAVIIFNEQGELLLTLGGFYAVAASGKVAPGGFSVPVAIDIDSTDRMYVVDQLNSRIQVFQYLPDSFSSGARGR